MYRSVMDAWECPAFNWRDGPGYALGPRLGRGVELPIPRQGCSLDLKLARLLLGRRDTGGLLGLIDVDAEIATARSG
jgi:hypothetical protein